jgi:tRNA A-37 threonylcarbamoyl transferase component Bud32
MMTSQGYALIAEGATAEVFAYGEGRILKRYREGYPALEAVREAERAKIAAQHLAEFSLHTPAVIDVGTFEGRPGVVFERVIGISLLECLLTGKRDILPVAVEVARLHRVLHCCTGRGLPSQKERLRSQCDRSTVKTEYVHHALRFLDKLTEGNNLCHGDFHPANILWTDGGLVIIDWVDAVSGNLLGDVARTVVLLLTASTPIPDGWTSRRLWYVRRRFVDLYLLLYPIDPHSARMAQLLPWIFVVAVARSGEGGHDANERRRLMHLLKGLLPAVLDWEKFVEWSAYRYAF